MEYVRRQDGSSEPLQMAADARGSSRGVRSRASHGEEDSPEFTMVPVPKLPPPRFSAEDSYEAMFKKYGRPTERSKASRRRVGAGDQQSSGRPDGTIQRSRSPRPEQGARADRRLPGGADDRPTTPRAR